MWNVWKNLFMEVVDKHAPLQSKRVSNKHSPWITYELTRKIHKRNYMYMKKISIQENSATAWERYKQARNKVNQQRNGTSAAEMADVFNDFFATIGSNLSSGIQPSTIEPEFYLQPTDTMFSLKPPSASTVCRLLNQLDTKKATGLDRIPCKLLKLSNSIVGPSLAYILKSCINAEIFPNEWKIAKVTPLFKKDLSVN